MPEPDFEELRRHLLDAGVSPRYIRRTVAELRDHHEDLKLDIVEQGGSAREATDIARRQLGNLELIAAHVTSRIELRRWMYRYPSIGRLALPILCVAALPIAPIVAGANHAPALVRWSAILTLSALVTAGLFLAMQLSISLG